MIIGITGRSGSGKTTIATEIALLKNAKIINADATARKMQEKGEEYYKKIVEIFGKEILTNKRRNR